MGNISSPPLVLPPCTHTHGTDYSNHQIFSMIVSPPWCLNQHNISNPSSRHRLQLDHYPSFSAFFEMGKRDRPKDETKEQKKARKREKKEAKKRKRAAEEEATTSTGPKVASALTNQNGAPALTEQRGRSEDSKMKESRLLCCKKLRVSVSILPAGLRDVKSSIENCLGKFMLKYSEAVGGVVLAYKDMEVMTNGRGKIVEELPHVIYDVTCEALVFQPTPKARLIGTVTGSFHSHISLVVFDYFNASISAAHLRNGGFQYDSSTDLWYVPNSGYVVQKSTSVSFEIDTVHEASKCNCACLLYLRIS